MAARHMIHLVMSKRRFACKIRISSRYCARFFARLLTAIQSLSFKNSYSGISFSFCSVSIKLYSHYRERRVRPLISKELFSFIDIQCRTRGTR